MQKLFGMCLGVVTEAFVPETVDNVISLPPSPLLYSVLISVFLSCQAQHNTLVNNTEKMLALKRKKKKMQKLHIQYTVTRRYVTLIISTTMVTRTSVNWSPTHQ